MRPLFDPSFTVLCRKRKRFSDYTFKLGWWLLYPDDPIRMWTWRTRLRRIYYRSHDNKPARQGIWTKVSWRRGCKTSVHHMLKTRGPRTMCLVSLNVFDRLLSVCFHVSSDFIKNWEFCMSLFSPMRQNKEKYAFCKTIENSASYWKLPKAWGCKVI